MLRTPTGDVLHLPTPSDCLSLLFLCLKAACVALCGQAVELITRALEIDEKCEFAYETLGTIEVQRGNLRQGQYLAAAN